MLDLLYNLSSRNLIFGLGCILITHDLYFFGFIIGCSFDLDCISYINNMFFENMVSVIYPSELRLNKADSSDTETPFVHF